MAGHGQQDARVQDTNETEVLDTDEAEALDTDADTRVLEEDGRRRRPLFGRPMTPGPGPDRRLAFLFDDFWPAVALLALGGLALVGALWYLTTHETKTVPRVESQRLETAVDDVQAAGLDVAIVSASNASPRGTVFEQQPSGGSELEEGETVTLRVSTGPASVKVPNAVGLPEREARDRLAAAGLQVNVFEVFSDEPKGTVVAQNPAAGERASGDATVRLNVSQGTATVSVPLLVGQTREAAEAELAERDLDANVFAVPSSEPEGTVVAQNPQAGKVRRGSSVRLNVSTGTQTP